MKIIKGRVIYWCQGCGQEAKKYYPVNTRKYNCCESYICSHKRLQFYCKDCYKRFKNDSKTIINSYEKINFY